MLLFIYFFGSSLRNISLIVFFIYTISILILVNLNAYEEIIFEILLYFDIIGKINYINSEIIYALTIIHILVFINLKKFENIWDIIDKKLFRI